MASAFHHRFFLQTLLLPVLFGAVTTAAAQTPAARMMPDGSRDMYIGAGLAYAPRYQGSDEQRTKPAALLQMQWSNGIFVSGLSAGMHMSDAPTVEYGPLVAIEPGRSASGERKLSGIDAPLGTTSSSAGRASETTRFTEIGSRLEAGGFFNYYFDESLRVTSSLLYGAGNDRDGLLFNLGIQKALHQLTPHHRLSLSTGVTWANRDYTQAYFGNATYRPGAGVRDVQLALNWNWELSNLWLLTTQMSVSRLLGPAADSPLVDRRYGVTVRTGLTYRF